MKDETGTAFPNLKAARTGGSMMQTPQSRIDDLLARPSEGLSVEIKSWIDPAEPEGTAKIARACLAMRNQNGGFLLIGLNDLTLQFETVGKPTNVRESFHADKVQQLVSRFANDGFEIEVAFGAKDGAELPVIVIPDGIQYPVASKSELAMPDGKKLIRFGDVYCRTLNSNGRVSTAVAQPKDWRGIFDRCFENREADIGRFLRRHLGSSGEGLVSLQVKPQTTLQGDALSLLDEGLSHFVQAAAARDLKGRALEIANGAKFEAALVVQPLKSGELPTAAFRQTLFSSNPNLTGWPAWLDSTNFRDELARPVVRGNSWETLITSLESWSDHLDFYHLNPNGKFYLLRNLEDDSTDRIQAGTMLDPILVILRVAETIIVGLSFVRALEWKPEEAKAGFAFRWSKLKGRKLYAWARPEVHISAHEKTTLRVSPVMSMWPWTRRTMQSLQPLRLLCGSSSFNSAAIRCRLRQSKIGRESLLNGGSDVNRNAEAGIPTVVSS